MADSGATNGYDEILEKTKNLLHEYVDSEWPVTKQKSSVTVSWKRSPLGVNIYKAVGVIDATPELTLEYMLPGPGRVRTRWDLDIKEQRLVEQLDQNTIVLQSITGSAAMGLISSRDFVDVIQWGVLEEVGLHYTYACGVDHPDCPSSDSCVRGLNHPCGTFCYAIDGGTRTKLVYMLQTDIKGSVPVSLVESFLPSTVISFYGKLQNAINNKLLDSHNKK